MGWSDFQFSPCPECCECDGLFAYPSLTLVFSGITACCSSNQKVTSGSINPTIVVPKTGYCQTFYVIPAFYTVTSYDGGTNCGIATGTQTCDLQLQVCCEVGLVFVTLLVSTNAGNPSLFGGSGAAGTVINSDYPLCSSGFVFGSGGTVTVSP